jgi:hypothetical protein
MSLIRSSSILPLRFCCLCQNLEPDLVLYHQCVAAVAVSRVLSRSNSNTAQLSDDSMTHRVIVTLKSEDGTSTASLLCNESRACIY